VDLYCSFYNRDLPGAYVCGQARAESVLGFGVPRICTCFVGDHMGIAVDPGSNEQAFRVVFIKSLTSNFNSGTEA